MNEVGLRLSELHVWQVCISIQFCSPGQQQSQEDGLSWPSQICQGGPLYPSDMATYGTDNHKWAKLRGLLRQTQNNLNHLICWLHIIRITTHECNYEWNNSYNLLSINVFRHKISLDNNNQFLSKRELPSCRHRKSLSISKHLKVGITENMMVQKSVSALVKYFHAADCSASCFRCCFSAPHWLVNNNYPQCPQLLICCRCI